MKRGRLLLLIVLSLLCIHSQAQSSEGEIEGVVLDGQTQEPLLFASVTVFQKINNRDSLVGGIQTSELGKFSITHLPIAALIIRVSYVGYQSFEKAVTLSKESASVKMGSLSLTPDATVLSEVNVVGEKSDLEITPEKRIYNVSKNMTSVGGTAEALLRNVPSLTIDESGAASLRNMPTTIYINGKPTQLTLAQIPANQIASVEVISNPSAKYDASTSGGIVNLVLKQNREEGYNGIINLGVGNNSRYDATVNLDWQKKKWNFTGLYSLNSTRNPLTGYVHRESKNPDGTTSGNFNQDTDISLDNLFQSGRIAAEYRPNASNTISLAGTVVGGAYNTISDQSYYYANELGEETSFGTRTTVPQNNYINTGVELDWRHVFARKGQELHFVTSFTHNRVSNAGDWLTTAYNVEGIDSIAQEGYPVRNRIDGRIIGNQTLLQLDYVHPINERVKLEFGLRSFTYVRDQEYFFSEVNDDVKELLQNYSQDAAIRETVNAVYTSFNQQITKKLAMQAGLRLEQSSLHGLSRFDGRTFGYQYPSANGQNFFQSFFPSLAFTNIINESSEWNFSLSRKVGRPNFRHMFVGVQANDRQNITIGNPSVRPEFVNTAEFSYSKTWNRGADQSIQWLPTAYYIYEDHTIKPIVSPLETDSTILVTTFQNIKADIQYGIDNTLTYSSGPFSFLWNMNVCQVVLQSNDLTNRLIRYTGKVNVTYRFNAGISAQVSAQRRSRTPSLQGYQEPVNGVDFALRKSLWQNKGNITFSINDVFNSRKFVSVYDQPGTYQVSMNRREIRYFKLSVQIPLGKLSNGKTKERKVAQPDIDFSN